MKKPKFDLENTQPFLHQDETQPPVREQQNITEIIERVERQDAEFTRQVEHALQGVFNNKKVRIIEFEYLYDEGVFDVKFEVNGEAGSIRVKKAA